jgi:hypothetical protein
VKSAYQRRFVRTLGEVHRGDGDGHDGHDGHDGEYGRLHTGVTATSPRARRAVFSIPRRSGWSRRSSVCL